ncbi:MAG: glycosyltransferase family 2 protein [Anaerolineae bacterium]|nr:glycosyltransferase family 2 protein [Anaerolineae bacterium]
MPQCSIVIRAYNEEEHIGRLLSGIMQQTVQNVEIILIDSGSTDATVSIASRYPIKLLSIRPEEFSFGRSLNLGCQAAAGEFIVIVSAHVYPVHRDWLAHLLQPFQNPQIGLVYGKQRGNATTQYAEHQIFARWFPEESNPNQEFPFCNNANAAIRRPLWQQLPYDESLTGLEDLDWAKRAMALGYNVAYQAEAEIIHVHNETAQQTYNRYRREAIALKQIYPQEHFYLGDFVRLLTANISNDYYHAWRDRVLARNLWAITRFRLLQLWGTYRGFVQHGPVTSQLKQTFYYPRQRQSTADLTAESRINRPLVNYHLFEQRSHDSIE